jgi:hypothetical protein
VGRVLLKQVQFVKRELVMEAFIYSGDAIAFVFGLKTLEEIEQAFKGHLSEALTGYYSSGATIGQSRIKYFDDRANL